VSFEARARADSSVQMSGPREKPLAHEPPPPGLGALRLRHRLSGIRGRRLGADEEGKVRKFVCSRCGILPEDQHLQRLLGVDGWQGEGALGEGGVRVPGVPSKPYLGPNHEDPHPS
jgi:hypothetical protein